MLPLHMAFRTEYKRNPFIRIIRNSTSLLLLHTHSLGGSCYCYSNRVRKWEGGKAGRQCLFSPSLPLPLVPGVMPHSAPDARCPNKFHFPKRYCSKLEIGWTAKLNWLGEKWSNSPNSLGYSEPYSEPTKLSHILSHLSPGELFHHAL